MQNQNNKISTTLVAPSNMRLTTITTHSNAGRKQHQDRGKMAILNTTTIGDGELQFSTMGGKEKSSTRNSPNFMMYEEEEIQELEIEMVNNILGKLTVDQMQDGCKPCN